MKVKAVHNLTILNHGMHDPALTPHGENQCLQLQSKFPHHDCVDLLVCSPLQRTIQTTLLAFDPEISRGVPCIALPEVQETSDLPCDTGSSIAKLKEMFKDKPVDLTLLPQDWDSKVGKWAPEQEAIERRCRDARQWLKTHDEKAIVVVTHGGLLHYLTEDWAGCEKFQGEEKNLHPSDSIVSGSTHKSLLSRYRMGKHRIPFLLLRRWRQRECIHGGNNRV